MERRRSTSESSGLDQTLCPDVYDNYSILMYETQDAFKHSEKLLRKLKSCEEQLRVANDKCKQLLEEKSDLEKSIISFAKNSNEREDQLTRNILKTEEELSKISKRNEWLEKQLNVREESRVNLKETTSSIEMVKNLKAELSATSTQSNNKANSLKKYKRDDSSSMSVDDYDLSQEKQEEDFQTEQKKKSTTLVSSDTSIVSNEIKNIILKIKSVQRENDTKLQTIVKNCCAILKENGSLLKSLYDENNTATIKIEKWINGYMILKRKKEEESELSKREHARSTEIEIENRNQIKYLCEMIQQLNAEVGIERAQTQNYKTSLTQIYKNLEEIDKRFENISHVAIEKLSKAETKVQNMILKCSQIKSSPPFSKKNKRLSKTLFKLKRRISDSKERMSDSKEKISDSKDKLSDSKEKISDSKEKI